MSTRLFCPVSRFEFTIINMCNRMHFLSLTNILLRENRVQFTHMLLKRTERHLNCICKTCDKFRMKWFLFIRCVYMELERHTCVWISSLSKWLKNLLIEPSVCFYFRNDFTWTNMKIEKGILSIESTPIDGSNEYVSNVSEK